MLHFVCSRRSHHLSQASASLMATDFSLTVVLAVESIHYFVFPLGPTPDAVVSFRFAPHLRIVVVLVVLRSLIIHRTGLTLINDCSQGVTWLVRVS